MKSYVLLLALLLSACASDFWTFRGKPGPEPQPAVRQQPAPAEAQQPARVEPVAIPPKKHEHNIEED